jgi:hypothetical protein
MRRRSGRSLAGHLARTMRTADREGERVIIFYKLRAPLEALRRSMSFGLV